MIASIGFYSFLCVFCVSFKFAIQKYKYKEEKGKLLFGILSAISFVLLIIFGIINFV